MENENIQIAELMFSQMNSTLKASNICSAVIASHIVKDVKKLFQEDYVQNHREKGDPLRCPYYEYTTETILPGVVRLIVRHVSPTYPGVLVS